MSMMQRVEELGGISPFFIVGDLGRAVGFYRDKLGFEVRVRAPDEDPFFAIVGRDATQIFLEVISDEVLPCPNSSRHEWAPWDAFVFVPEPEALASEFEGRGCKLQTPTRTRDDGLRGFEVRDSDGYVIFFGSPV